MVRSPVPVRTTPLRSHQRQRVAVDVARGPGPRGPLRRRLLVNPRPDDLVWRNAIQNVEHGARVVRREPEHLPDLLDRAVIPTVLLNCVCNAGARAAGLAGCLAMEANAALVAETHLSSAPPRSPAPATPCGGPEAPWRGGRAAGDRGQPEGPRNDAPARIGPSAARGRPPMHGRGARDPRQTTHANVCPRGRQATERAGQIQRKPARSAPARAGQAATHEFSGSIPNSNARLRTVSDMAPDPRARGGSRTCPWPPPTGPSRRGGVPRRCCGRAPVGGPHRLRCWMLASQDGPRCALQSGRSGHAVWTTWECKAS